MTASSLEQQPTVERSLCIGCGHRHGGPGRQRPRQSGRQYVQESSQLHPGVLHTFEILSDMINQLFTQMR